MTLSVAVTNSWQNTSNTEGLILTCSLRGQSMAAGNEKAH